MRKPSHPPFHGSVPKALVDQLLPTADRIVDIIRKADAALKRSGKGTDKLNETKLLTGVMDVAGIKAKRHEGTGSVIIRFLYSLMEAGVDLSTLPVLTKLFDSMDMDSPMTAAS